MSDPCYSIPLIWQVIPARGCEACFIDFRAGDAFSGHFDFQKEKRKTPTYPTMFSVIKLLLKCVFKIHKKKKIHKLFNKQTFTQTHNFPYALPARLRIPQQYPLKKGTTPFKRGVLGIKLDFIQWWGSSRSALRSVKYL